MKVLIDTCVVMDFLQRREPFAKTSKRIFRAVASEQFLGYITAKAATDIYYLTHRFTHSNEESRRKLNQLLSLVSLLDTSAEDIFHAISSDVVDFEDAVMIETAIRLHIDCIVTRNIKDYKKSPIPIYTPDDLMNKFQNRDKE